MCYDWARKNSDYFFFVFRVFVGLFFAIHGAMKFGLIGKMNIAGVATAMGLPLWLMIIVAIIELVGGLMILLGLFTRVAATFTAIDMIGAIIYAHIPKGILTGELAIIYLMTFLVLISQGGRIWRIDSLFMKKEI